MAVGKKNTRTLPLQIHFNAFTNGYTVYIQNTNPNCDITVQIIDYTGQAIIKEEIPKDETYIVIPIDVLSDGNYTLEIRNSFGGYVYGSFIKDTDNF